MKTRRECAKALAAFRNNQSREYNREKRLEAYFNDPTERYDTDQKLEQYKRDDRYPFQLPSTNSGTQKENPPQRQPNEQADHAELEDYDASLCGVLISVPATATSRPPNSTSKLAVVDSNKAKPTSKATNRGSTSQSQEDQPESPSRSLSESSFNAFLFDLGTDLENWMTLMEWNSLANDVTLASCACVESTAQGIAEIAAKLIDENNKLLNNKKKSPKRITAAVSRVCSSTRGETTAPADNKEQELGMSYFFSSPTDGLVSSKVEAEQNTKRKRSKRRPWRKSRAK